MAVVKNLNLPSFPTFDTSEVTTLPTRWKKYKQRFQLLCTAIGVGEAKQKLAMLLTYMGDDSYEIFENIKPSAEPTFDEVITAFDKHFEPQVNVSYETFLFRNLKQHQEETLHQFFIRLKEQATKCAFHDMDKEIKQQIELATTNNKLRMHSFQHPKTTLQELLVVGRTLEETNRQVEILQKSQRAENAEEDVNFIKNNNSGKRKFVKRGMSMNQNKTCFRCGGKYPHERNCPAEDKICNKCQRKGHFAKCCKTKGGNLKKRTFGTTRPLNQIDTHSPLNSENLYENMDSLKLEETLFSLKECEVEQENELRSGGAMDTKSVFAYDKSAARASSTPDAFKKTNFEAVVYVEKVPVQCLVDTGASINVLTLRTFNQLQTKLKGKLCLQKTKTKVITYGNNEPSLKVLGKVELLVETSSKFLCANFLVIDTSHKNVLSGDTALALCILKFSKPLYTITSNQPTETTDKKPNTKEKLQRDLTCLPNRIKDVVNKYNNTVFSQKIGKLKGYEVKLHIDKEIPPVAQRERRIPFALRDKVNREIEKLEKAGIVEDVTDEPTPWLNPLVIVPKADGTIRLCVDMRCANKAIKRTRYPTPTVDDLKTKLKGANLFTKLDMRSAFHQLELSKESRYITAFQSDIRIKRFTRLIFGVNSAPEELQHVIRALISDIEGVINIADDLLIYAKDVAEHDKILINVLNRFEEKGLTLNLNKCEFCSDNLEFFGHVFSKEGMKPSPKKTEALINTPQPDDQKALRSFLGLTNYLKTYIPDYSTKTYPLRQLLKNDAKWEWSDACEEAFQLLKTTISSSTCISYFDEKKDTFLFTDASPFGISAILMQKTCDKNNPKIVSYSSRALTQTEMNYAQIERECLAVVYGCERNRLYLIGRPFSIYNDHKALVNILNNPKSIVPPRIERLTLRLRGYDFDLQHVKSADNISDYSSRHPHDESDRAFEESTEEYINTIVEYSRPNAITIEDIKRETKNDKICNKLIELVNTQQWNWLDNKEAIQTFSEEDIKELKHYRSFREQLSLSEGHDIILKHTKIVLPKCYHNIAVNLAHVGHQGIVKTKALLRSKVYFKNIDEMVKKRINECIACQAVDTKPRASPVQIMEIPKNVWSTVNADFIGPFPNGKYLFVIIDQRSRFPVVETVNSTSANTLIPCLQQIFCTYGNPDTIVTDNGPPFQSTEFADFLHKCGTKHRRITPIWPQANGEAERFMKPLKKIAQTANIENKNWISELHNFLFSYRNTPHSSTKVAPAAMMFNRNPNFNIPQLTSKVNIEDLQQKTDANDRMIKERNKLYMDAKRHASDSQISLGDSVLVRQPKRNKLTSHYKPQPMTVTQVKGTMVTATNENDNRITRNVTHFKRIAPTTTVTVQQRNDEQSERKQYPRRERKQVRRY